MKKIIDIYYTELTTYAEDTGLIFELEDGTFIAQMSTDILTPFRDMEKEEVIKLTLAGKVNDSTEAQSPVMTEEELQKLAKELRPDIEVKLLRRTALGRQFWYYGFHFVVNGKEYGTYTVVPVNQDKGDWHVIEEVLLENLRQAPKHETPLV